MSAEPAPLPKRSPRPTKARCPQCRCEIGVYREGDRDCYMAHSYWGAPLAETDGRAECRTAGWLVEDDEVVG